MKPLVRFSHQDLVQYTLLADKGAELTAEQERWLESDDHAREVAEGAREEGK